MTNKFFAIAIAFLVIISCSQRIKFKDGTNNGALVVHAVILDFYNTSPLVNRDNTFNVSFSDLDPQIWKVVITGDTNKFYIENGEHLNRIPNNFLEIKDKLFYWTDPSNEILGELVMEKLNMYGLVEYDVDVITTHLDHNKKAVTYIFCKNDLSNYKKKDQYTLVLKT